jgi:phosphatidylserine decarboxylase
MTARDSAPGAPLSLGARLFVALQHLLPQHSITRFIYLTARIRTPWLKRLLIRGFLKLYTIDLAEAANSDPDSYATFNEFFTRALRDGARPLCTGERDVASPCDGTVSQRGTIEAEGLLQAKLAAKSHWYSLESLLADPVLATEFVGGEFATIYLAPYNYHRVHMPLTGRLRAVRYVPGRLYSVNAATASAVPGLFALNERVVCVFDTQAGPMAVIFVGALNVGSVGLVFAGDVTPTRPRRGRLLEIPAEPLVLERGAELGRFNMGSTVIVLLPKGACTWEPEFRSGRPVRMGAAIARLASGTAGAPPATPALTGPSTAASTAIGPATSSAPSTTASPSHSPPLPGSQER